MQLGQSIGMAGLRLRLHGATGITVRKETNNLSIQQKYKKLTK